MLALKRITHLHQQKPAQKFTSEVAVQGTQHGINSYQQHRKKEKMEVDRTHGQETSSNHHPFNHHMERPRLKTKRKATEALIETNEMGHIRRQTEKIAKNRQ